MISMGGSLCRARLAAPMRAARLTGLGIGIRVEESDKPEGAVITRGMPAIWPHGRSEARILDWYKIYGITLSGRNV